MAYQRFRCSRGHGFSANVTHRGQRVECPQCRDDDDRERQRRANDSSPSVDTGLTTGYASAPSYGEPVAPAFSPGGGGDYGGGGASSSWDSSSSCSSSDSSSSSSSSSDSGSCSGGGSSD